MFTIDNAPVEILRDYAHYCETKNDIDETPLTFQQWQEWNLAASIDEPDLEDYRNDDDFPHKYIKDSELYEQEYGCHQLDEEDIREREAIRHEFFD